MDKTADVLVSSSSSDLAPGTKQGEAIGLLEISVSGSLCISADRSWKKEGEGGGLVWVWGWFFSRVHV